MNSAEVRTLKNELHRFEPKPCRTCQFIFGFGVLVFLISITLFLFAQKGVSPSSIIPVQSIPHEKPLTRKEEANILEDLRLSSIRPQSAEIPLPDYEGYDEHGNYIEAGSVTKKKQ